MPGEFDNRIIIRPGVTSALIQLNGLLRPLIQRSWALKVARLNQLDDAVLHDFLFGQERSALARVRTPLAELQDDRCFYCAERLDRRMDVDHFLPWAQVPNDNLENLVIAHPRCNGAKRDFLPDLSHLPHSERPERSMAGSPPAPSSGDSEKTFRSEGR